MNAGEDARVGRATPYLLSQACPLAILLPAAGRCAGQSLELAQEKGDGLESAPVRENGGRNRSAAQEVKDVFKANALDLLQDGTPDGGAKADFGHSARAGEVGENRTRGQSETSFLANSFNSRANFAVFAQIAGRRLPPFNLQRRYQRMLRQRGLSLFARGLSPFVGGLSPGEEKRGGLSPLALEDTPVSRGKHPHNRRVRDQVPEGTRVRSGG